MTWIPIIAFVFVLFVVVHELWRTAHPGECIPATVTEVIPDNDKSYHHSGSSASWGANRKMYRVYVQYEKDGVAHQAMSDRKYSNPDMFPGQEVMVSVDKKNPDTVYIVCPKAAKAE